MAQENRILAHLEAHGSITSAEAMKEYGIMRLASRVSDLKSRGYPIVKTMETGRNRYGEKVVYARYSLKKSDRPEDGASEQSQERKGY